MDLYFDRGPRHGIQRLRSFPCDDIFSHSTSLHLGKQKRKFLEKTICTKLVNQSSTGGCLQHHAGLVLLQADVARGSWT